MPAVPERSASGSKKQKPADKSSSTAQPDLLKYGITAVPTMSYEWGGYRYTNAHDAIAAAKRGVSS
jgi:hypothetical protein